MKLLLPLSCVFAGNNISTRRKVESLNITPYISRPGCPVLALLPDHLRPLPRPAPHPGRGGGRGLAAALQLRGKQVADQASTLHTHNWEPLLRHSLGTTFK